MSLQKDRPSISRKNLRGSTVRQVDRRQIQGKRATKSTY